MSCCLFWSAAAAQQQQQQMQIMMGMPNTTMQEMTMTAMIQPASALISALTESQ